MPVIRTSTTQPLPGFWNGCPVALPDGAPFGLSDEFSVDAQKQAQWNAFLRRNRLTEPDLDAVGAEIRTFVRSLKPQAEPMTDVINKAKRRLRRTVRAHAWRP